MYKECPLLRLKLGKINKKYAGVDPEMDTALIIGTKIDSMPYMKTKLVYKMWKCGSGNEHCDRGTGICYTRIVGIKKSN